MSLFGGLSEGRDIDDDAASNVSESEKPSDAFHPEPDAHPERTPTRDEGEEETSKKSTRGSTPERHVGAKGAHTPVGPHTPSGSEPQTPTTSTEGECRVGWGSVSKPPMNYARTGSCFVTVLSFCFHQAHLFAHRHSHPERRFHRRRLLPSRCLTPGLLWRSTHLVRVDDAFHIGV